MTTNDRGTLALLKLPRHLSLSLDGSPMNTLRDPQDVLVIRDIPPGFHLLAVRHGTVEDNVYNNNKSNKGDAAASGAGAGAPVAMSSSMMTLGLALFFPTTATATATALPSSSSSSLFLVKEYNVITEEWSKKEIDDMTKQNLFKAIIESGVLTPRPRQEECCSNQTTSPIMDANKILHYKNFLSPQTERRLHREEEQQQQQQQQLGSTGRNLGSIWSMHLTNYISLEVLNRHSLTGKGDEIIPSSYTAAAAAAGPSPWNDDHIVSALGGSSAASVTDHPDGKVLQYVPIPIPPWTTIQRRGPERESAVASIHRHEGTKRYLATLSPQERTAFFFLNVHRQPQQQQQAADRLVVYILKGSYGSKWENFIGEFQLSFVLFLCCSCLSSLEHWRDVICMLSHVSSDLLLLPGNGSVPGGNAFDMVQMFHALLVTLYHQLDGFDCAAIFDDDDYSHGNDVIPSIKGIVEVCQCAYNRATAAASSKDGSDIITRSSSTCWKELHQIATSLTTLLCLKNLDGDVLMQGEEGEDDSTDHDASNANQHDDEEEDDGPVIVTMEEIEESMERNASSKRTFQSDEYRERRDEYPFLFAAISENEDVVMACARILDEQNDATLVREAASYLERVEAHRNKL